jgi:polyisoprenoid-binding protein YceI
VAHYILDKDASRFTARVFATGMLSALGHSPTIAIRNFAGEAEYDPAAPEKASLKVRIRADSLQVTDDISSKDRNEIEKTMNEKVLEVSKFPEITFESTGVSEREGQLSMQGILSLHGETKSLPIAARVMLLGDSLRASGEFSIQQSDFDIAPVSVAGGTLKLKDELKFSFDIVARKA